MRKYTWSNLPKKDKKHLKENKILYKWQFMEQIEHQKKQLSQYDRTFTCYECISIAKKLGLWDK